MLTALLERYKSRWGRDDEPSQVPDKALNDTYLRLYQSMREHHFVDVCVKGDDAVYQSMILALDPGEKTVLIDELFPRGFVGLPGQRVDVTVRQSQGQKIRFETTILEQHDQEDVPLYVLAMPDSLDSDQRRNAYRLPIGRSLAIRPQFIGPDNQNYLARLCNLSTRGVAMEVEVDDPDSFHDDDELQHVAFDFAGISFDCDMKVRNVLVRDSDPNPSNSTVVIGAEFQDLPPLDERVLERSIMRIQRDRIRMGADMEAQLISA